MKTYLKILFFFLLVTQICFAQWVQLGLEDKSIKDIAVHMSIIYAISSDRGSLYRSTDNGINWLQIVDSSATDIATSSSGTIFMIRDSLNYIKQLFASADDGNTWSRLSGICSGNSSNLIEVSVGSSGFVLCGIDMLGYKGTSTTITISTDDGLTWSPCDYSIFGGVLFDFRDQSVISAGHQHPLVGGYEIYMSSDIGRTWSFVGYPPLGGFIYNIKVLGLCLNGNILFGAAGFEGEGGGLWFSSDSCNTWTQVSTIIPQAGLSIESGGMLLGTDSLGVFLFSDNGDSLGSHNDGLTSLNIHTLTIDNNYYVYAGTDNGVWRRPLSEIVTSVEENPIQVPSDFNLSQNYPNPFNPSTTIKYSIPIDTRNEIRDVRLIIYDILGREVATLVNEQQKPGNYEVEFNGSELTSGVYFYQLKAGEFTETKKMLLVK